MTRSLHYDDTIKASKTLVWHLSREPIKGNYDLKEKNNYMTNKPKDEQPQERTDLGMNTVR